MSYQAIREIGHFAPLLPMLACVALSLARRSPSPDAWVLTCAFFVSFIADQFAAFLQAQHVTNLWLFLVYAPIQFGLFAAVLSPTRPARATSGALVLLAFCLSAVVTGFGNVEVLGQVIGGVVVATLVWYQQRTLGRYAVPLLIYCVATIPPLAVMASFAPSVSGPWFVGWVVYQALRVAALVMMTYAVVTHPTMRLEVRHGRGAGKAADGSGVALRLVGGGDRHAVETARRAGLI